MKIFTKEKEKKRDPWEILMESNLKLLTLAKESAR